MKQKKMILTFLLSAALLLAVLPAFFGVAPIAKAAEKLTTSQITRSPASFVYDGSVHHPTVTVKNAAGETLTEGTDYTVVYPAGSTDPGTYYLRVDGRGGYSGSVRKVYTITTALTASNVTYSSLSFTYNGSVQKPSVSVKNNAGDTLTSGTDYTVSYSAGSKVAGTYTVTVSGKGLYSGSVSKNYKITALALVAANITRTPLSFVYDGTAHIPAVTVKDADDNVLTEGVDYKVSVEDTGYKPVSAVSRASYFVRVDGIGGYSGTVRKTFTVKAQPLDEANVTCASVTLPYTGSAQYPSVTVKNAAGKTLTKGTDYTVAYSAESTAPGSYTLTVTGKGNYTGSVTKDYTISGGKIEASRVTRTPITIVYDVTPQRPAVTVKDAEDNVLTEDVDYRVFVEDASLKAVGDSVLLPGSYFVRVTGIGGYTGTVRKSFTVKAQQLNAANITCSSVNLTYNGSVQQPSVTVKNAAGRVMVKDRDYTVAYSAESVTPGTYTLTVTGVGGYAGTVTLNYSISGGKLVASKITRTPTSFIYDGTAHCPAVTVLDAADNVLTEGVDYRVTVEDSGYHSVSAVEPASYFVKVTAIGAYTGTVRKAFTVKAQPLQEDKITCSAASFIYNGQAQKPTVSVKNAQGETLTANTDYTVAYSANSKNVGAYTVTVTGKGNYSGAVTKSYEITAQKLVTANITRTPASFIYDGTAQIPAVEVKDADGNVLTENVDYTVAAVNGSYQTVSAVAPGSYFVKVTGVGNFSGAIKKTFTVKAQPLQAANVSASPESFAYNGNTQQPAVTVTDAQGRTLTEGTDYTVTWPAASQQPGDYTVTVAGKGNYSGTATQSYAITGPAALTADQIVITGTCFQYDGTVKTPAVTVTAFGKTLVKDTDYTVSYSGNCIDNGTYTVTVAGAGIYTGSVSADFTISESGHTPEEIPARAVTCTVDGLTAGSRCAVCGIILTEQNVIPALGHNMAATEAVAATCLAPGNNKYYTCGTCGKVFTDAEGTVETTVAAQTLAQLEHSYTGNIQNNLDGTHSFQCVNGCEEFGEPVACNKFAYLHTPATCTEKARTEKRCTECGMVLETVIDENSVPTGHTASVYTPPTCTEAGYDEINCTNEFVVVSTSEDDLAENYEEILVCGYMEKTYRTAPEEQALGHQLNDNSWTTEIAATCLAGGTETNVCTREGCGQTVTRDTDALGHDIEGVSPEVTAATCTSTGLRIYRCKRCDEPGKTEIIPATHVFTGVRSTVTLDAFCTYDGYTITECKKGCTIDEEDLAVNDLVKLNATTLQCLDGSTFTVTNKIKAVYGIITEVGENGAFTVNFAPIGHPETEGVYTANDFTAPATKRVITPAKGHTAASTTIQARTCTQDGIIEYSGHCNNCNKDIPTTQVTIKATGHIPVEGVSPTCAEGVPCANTQYGQHDAIPPLGHDYVVPGCVLSSNAVNGFYCTRCGQTPATDAAKLSAFANILNLIKSPEYATNTVAAVGKTKMVTSYSKFDFGIYTSAVKSIYEREVSPVSVAYDQLESSSIFILFPHYYRQYAIKGELTMNDLDSIKIERIAGLNTDTLVTGYDETPDKGSAPNLSAYKGKTINENIIKVTLDMKDEYYAKTGSNIPVESRVEYGQRFFTEETFVSKILDYDIRRAVDEAGYDETTWSIAEDGDEFNMEMHLNWIKDSTKLTYYFTADNYEPIAVVCAISESMDQDMTMQVLSVNGEIKPVVNTERSYVYFFSNYFNGLS